MGSNPFQGLVSKPIVRLFWLVAIPFCILSLLKFFFDKHGAPLPDLYDTYDTATFTGLYDYYDTATLSRSISFGQIAYLSVLFGLVYSFLAFVFTFGVSRVFLRVKGHTYGRLTFVLAATKAYYKLRRAALALLQEFFELFSPLPPAPVIFFELPELAMCTVRREYLVSLRRGSILAAR